MEDSVYSGEDLVRDLAEILDHACVKLGFCGGFGRDEAIRYILSNCPMSHNQFGALVFARECLYEVPEGGIDIGEPERGRAQSVFARMFEDRFGRLLDPPTWFLEDARLAFERLSLQDKWWPSGKKVGKR